MFALIIGFDSDDVDIIMARIQLFANAHESVGTYNALSEKNQLLVRNAGLDSRIDFIPSY